jgi:uncharacterized protein
MTWMPGDLWVDNAPAKWRDQVPQVRQAPDGPGWYAEGKELGVFGGLGFGFDRVQRGYSKHVEKMFEVGFYEGGPHPTTPALRRKDQELDGVDAEVMYGILGVGQRLHDAELIHVVYEIYNSWVADFCKSDPRRFVGLACLPNHDPQAAARELRRVARLGLRGADFPVSTAVYPIWHGAWDPLVGSGAGLPHADLLPHHRLPRARARRRGHGDGVQSPVSRHAHDDVPGGRR